MPGWPPTRSGRRPATAPRPPATARQAFLDRFERQVDPDGILDPAERARRAESAKRAHFLRLSLKSARARRRARDLTATAAEAEAELSELGEPA